MRTSYIYAGLSALFTLIVPASIAKGVAVKYPTDLAGKYKCSAVHGTLNIIQRSDRRFEFDLDAMWIGDVTVGNVNTGNAHGVIELEGNTATYKDPDGPYTLTFKFTHNKVDIKYDGSGFGQWKVTPSGHYKKVSDPN